ncbi:Spc97 / Spc98 family of spindle pole body component [Prunus dulcis]|uniref:Gamma-tubulin complex component n=1 Tax=Prunus dulcis TaxID=3755 RepID=A0A4Y1RTP4_PRUDU|nr:Spc97 / Spc98 family of spindle pole body component [Prunus dulcis]
MVGIQGRYISIKRAHGKEDNFTFQVDASMDLALQELAKRVFPLCESFMLINQFVESRSQFKNGLVNHAFAAALRALLLDYQAMVAQLEHQFRLGRLSLQGLWFYCQAKAMAGDNGVRSLLEKMAECASNAYLGILERWVYEGVIDDPYGEFFIAENKSLQKESLTHDYDAKYWTQRYSLKDGIPSFLANISGTILTTGKYLNVMRECGHHMQVPQSENSKLMSFGSNHRYLECIKSAYDFASSELLNLIKEKYDLMGKLRSIKHYLLLDQGDFLVHFMDIARDELTKKLDEISVEKLQSLLDLALRTTAAATDPCHEDLTCCVEASSLLKKLGTLTDGERSRNVPDDNDLEEPVSITGLETFSLNYKIRWPLSIVISKHSLTKYQLIFRFLFHCKHVDRQLCGAWQAHQVIEPNWHVMHNRLQTAKSIDEKVERLKSLCLQYAAATQWLISSSIDVPSLVESDGSLVSEKPRQSKSRRPYQPLKLSSSNKTVADSILKFEREFNAELQSLGPILNSSSKAEPYLTHLSKCILGIGNEQ